MKLLHGGCGGVIKTRLDAHGIYGVCQKRCKCQNIDSASNKFDVRTAGQLVLVHAKASFGMIPPMRR